MRLPRGDEATVRRDKIEEYALSPEHPVGKHKARLFALLLGLTRADADLLIEALREAATAQDAIFGREDEHGQRYTLDFPFFGPDGNVVTIRSAWIVRDGAPPDLVTCFIL